MCIVGLNALARSDAVRVKVVVEVNADVVTEPEADGDTAPIPLFIFRFVQLLVFHVRVVEFPDETVDGDALKLEITQDAVASGRVVNESVESAFFVPPRLLAAARK